MSGRTLADFNRLVQVAYVPVVLALGLTASQIPPEGWRPLLAFLLVSLTGVALPLAYLSQGRLKSGALWTLGGVFAVLALGTTFIPSSSSSDDADGTREAASAAPTSDASPSPSAPLDSERAELTQSPEPTMAESSATGVKPMPRQVKVRLGTASRVYGGSLRLAVSSVYDDYAVMGLYMADQTCDWLFPDVGQTMVMVARDSLAYEVTLLSTSPDDEVRVEVRRRAPTEFEGGCPIT